MQDQAITQILLVEDGYVDPNKDSMVAALFNEDGTEFTGFTGAKGDTGDTGATGAAGADGLEALVTTATAIGTAAKTTVTDEPAAGVIVPVKFTNGNSAETPTLAFNGGTARAMKLGGTASTAAKLTVAANGVVLFYFDGTVLHQLGVVS